VRDAQGNILSVYKQVGSGTLKQDVVYLYGSIPTLRSAHGPCGRVPAEQGQRDHLEPTLLPHKRQPPLRVNEPPRQRTCRSHRPKNGQRHHRRCDLHPAVLYARCVFGAELLRFQAVYAQLEQYCGMKLLSLAIIYKKAKKP
jgi:hypothetical protein